MIETSPNGYHEPEDATAAMAGDLGDLSSDLLALLELQGELFRIDAKEAGTRAILPGALTVLAIAFALGACPLAMLGLAWALAEWTLLSATGAALIVSAGGLILAVLLAWTAVRGFRHSASALKDSLAEFRRNVRWIKTTLKRERRHSASARHRV